MKIVTSLVDKAVKAFVFKPMPAAVITAMGANFGTKARKIKVRLRRYSAARPGKCFENAYAYCMENPTAVYVVGYHLSFGAVPMEHAWIREGDKYLDVTYTDDAAEDSPYISMFELNAAQLTVLATQHKCKAPTLSECRKFKVAPNT